MKIIVSHKTPIGKAMLSPTDKGMKVGEALSAFASGFGSTVRAVPTENAEAYISEQVRRGYTCFEFDYTAQYTAETSIIKTEAA